MPRLPDPISTLEVIREPIAVTSISPKPDKNWRHTDTEGHEHYWDNGYPTLEPEEDYCVDCQDFHLEGWVCVECGERIVPGLVPPSGFSEFVPGLARYFLDGEEISKEEADEWLRQNRSSS